MISLAVSRGGRGVGVGRKVMEFCGSNRMPNPGRETFHSPSAISGTEQRILATYPDLR
jgi:hypothetical protein